MKMTKTVLAVAIAGIAAAPMMASATTTLSGVVQMQIAGSDSEAAHENLNGEGGFEDGEARIKNGDVNVGISASQALNMGLTGYGSVRLDVDGFSGTAMSGDSVYLGIKGGFGDIRIGEVPNAGEYGQFSDILGPVDMGTTVNQGISYTGSFGGATVGGTYSPATNHDLFAVGAKFGWNGLSIGVGLQNQDEKNNISAMVGFSYAGASISLGGVQIEGDENGATLREQADKTGLKANVGYSIAGVSLGLTYEAEQDSGDSKVRLDAGYDLGGGMNISARINSDIAGDAYSDEAVALEDQSNWRIQLSKSF